MKKQILLGMVFIFVLALINNASELKNEELTKPSLGVGQAKICSNWALGFFIPIDEKLTSETVLETGISSTRELVSQTQICCCNSIYGNQCCGYAERCGGNISGCWCQSPSWVSQSYQ